MSDIAVKKLINKLGRLRNEGYDPIAVLNESIVNGWKGVFPVKPNNGHNGGFPQKGVMPDGSMSVAAAKTLQIVEDIANEIQ